MAKRAFVTGGTGFLGQNVVAELCAQGWEVVALARSREKARLLGVSVVQGDLTDADALQAAMPADVDVVFHIAANISMRRSDAAQQHEDNVEGTRHLLAAARAQRAKRFVFTSTSAVWGLDHERFDEASEQHGHAARIPYVDSKIRGEALVLEASVRGLPSLILNPGHIVGAHDVAGWAQLFFQLRDGKLSLAPPGAASWCHARAVARAHVAAASRGQSGQRYLLGGVDAPYLAVTQRAAALMQTKPPTRVAPRFLLKTKAQLEQLHARFTGHLPAITPELARILSGRLVFSSARAERELGYAPSSLDVMLTDCHGWLVQSGHLQRDSLHLARELRKA